MRTFLLSLLLFCFCQINAQTITIRDKETTNPIELATIVSNNPNTQAITNSSGQADISEFKNSAWMEIRIIGYTVKRTTYQELLADNFVISLSPSIFSIDQVVVSANRWGQAKRDVPVKITTTRQAQIAFNNPQTTADLLGSTGDVFIQKSQQGGGSPMIRGFATNRLLIVVDGVRMNNAIFRSGNLQNVISLDAFAFEKTEVVFGPSSVIYGSDAIGGVMSFYSLSPKVTTNNKFDVSGNFASRYSTANTEKTGHIDINLGWTKWASLTSFTYTSYGDVTMGKNGPDEYLRKEYVKRENGVDTVVKNSNSRIQQPTGYSQINLMQKIAYVPNNNWNINYGLHYSTTSNYDRYDRLIAYKNGLPRSAEWYYGPQVWLMNNVNIENTTSNTFYDKLTVNAAHQLFEESRNDRSFKGNTLKSRVENVQALNLNLDFKKSIQEKQTIFYGLEVLFNDIKSTGADKNITTGVKVDGPSRYPKSEWYSYAAYVTYHTKLGKKLGFQLGTRYNQYVLNARFDNTFYPFPYSKANINKGALTGSAGLIYTPTNSWKLNANLSTGFRSPNVDDLGKVFDSSPGTVIVPNPDLDAEYAYNAEIGITKTLGDYFEIDVNAFYTLLDNAMVKRNDLFNEQDSIMYDGELSQVQSIQNAAYAKVWGIQADFELMLTKQLMLSSRFNYQKGTEEIDNGTTSPLRHATPWFGVTKLTYTGTKLKMELFAHFSGEVSYSNLAEEERGKPYIYAIDSNGKPYSPSWYTLNFRSQYQINKTLAISGDVENITNQRYRPYSSGIVAPGFNFIVAVRARF
ncbi:MAG TPA: TonB-dependent receptor [Tenuifilaceae bacterium]|nr:TonB-dependent receptor [Tenuifilaceae bacterium]